MARFTWDEAKRSSNLHKHGLDFADAIALFSQDLRTFEDLSVNYHERRFVSTGWLHGRAVTVVYTETYHEIRIISFRTASIREENALYTG